MLSRPAIQPNIVDGLLILILIRETSSSTIHKFGSKIAVNEARQCGKQSFREGLEGPRRLRVGLAVKDRVVEQELVVAELVGIC